MLAIPDAFFRRVFFSWQLPRCPKGTWPTSAHFLRGVNLGRKSVLSSSLIKCLARQAAAQRTALRTLAYLEVLEVPMVVREPPRPSRATHCARTRYLVPPAVAPTGAQSCSLAPRRVGARLAAVAIAPLHAQGVVQPGRPPPRGTPPATAAGVAGVGAAAAAAAGARLWAAASTCRRPAG
jgi:hypothetical protein